MACQKLTAAVIGRVQGVGFRYFVMELAVELELKGWVTNHPDGSVRCEAVGSEGALRVFLNALKEGPAGSQVEEVTHFFEPCDPDEFPDFRVKRF
jgi:acylphosphatase